MRPEQDKFFSFKRLKLRDCLRLPEGWSKIAWCSYRKYRKRAEKENPPGFNFMMIGVFQGIVAQDTSLIDETIDIVRGTVPEDGVLCISGAALCSLGHCDEGLRRLREAVNMNPSPTNMEALASHLDNPEDYYEKLLLSQQVLKAKPDDVDSMRHAGFVLIEYDRPVEAEEYLRKALSIVPKNKATRELLGEIYFRRRMYKEALQQREAATGYFETTPYLFQQLAYCYYFTGKLRKAERAALKMVKVAARGSYTGPAIKTQHSILDEIRGLRKLGVEYCKPDIKDWALPLLKVEASREDQPAEATLFLAALETIQNKNTSHIENAVVRIADNVPKTDVLTVSGLARFEAADQTRGLEEMRKAIGLSASVQNMYNLAVCLSSLPDGNQEAEELFRKILRREPDHAASLCELAEIVDDTNEALELYNRASQIETSCWQTHFEAAECLCRLERWDQAIIVYQKARRLADANPARISIGIARCHLSIGDRQKARQNAERALVEDPSLNNAKELLAGLETPDSASPPPIKEDHNRNRGSDE